MTTKYRPTAAKQTTGRRRRKANFPTGVNREGRSQEIEGKYRFQ